MSQKQIDVLKRALERERKARKQAEKILEVKSLELFFVSEQLKEANDNLEDSLYQKKSELKGVFENINDAFFLMDLQGNVLKMNDVAVNLIGYDCMQKPINLNDIVHPDDKEYTLESFKKLYNLGYINKYTARLYTKNNLLKTLEVNARVVYDKTNKPIAAQGIARDISNDIQLKDFLHEEKNRLNIILENSPIGIALAKKGEIALVYINKTFANMLGYSLKEVQNMSFLELTHPEDRLISKLNVDKLDRGEIDIFNVEKRYIKKDGRILWGKTTVTAVRNSKGTLKFRVVTVEDISKERKAKDDLIESQNRLASLIVNLDSGVLLEDENRNIVITNQKFCDLFSIPIPPEILKGQDCSHYTELSKDLFEDPEFFSERINKIVIDKKPVIGDELKMNDGRILERDYIPIIQFKEYKGHLWTYRDVTLNRKYRKSLEAYKQKYSNIIANMDLGLVESDLSGIILLANQRFVEMSGFSERELLGKGIEHIIKDRVEREYVRRKYIDRMNGKSESYEFRYIDKNDETKYWLVSGAPNYDIQGNVKGTISIALDITHIKTLEIQKEKLLRKLKQSNEELEEYAHIVSHDLKSPLRSISALTSWLREDYEDKLDENGVNNINLIQDTVQKMENLINDILSYSSISEEQFVIESVNVNEVIESIKKLIFIPDHVTLKVDDSLPIIKADRTRIQQLFQNLLSNAVNYIDKEKGMVSVSAVSDKEHHTFIVKDNGIGIPEEYHKKIFNVFESFTKHKDSTGIGLSIVKKIVDMYDGKVWLESEKGVGTTFFIKLKK